ncbi:MAG TPA: hypothetical protein VKU94_03850 [Geobacterales bacterium]|nr:hypothetical protein [Geobacterales bacterium]
MYGLADCLPILRRRIGDMVSPYTYSDTVLESYLSDAIQYVETDWNRGLDVDSDNNIVSPNNIVLTKKDLNLFCVKAHYLIQLMSKDQADRNNFRMVKGRLTLDNTNQSKDHLDTLNLLDKEYRRLLHQTKNGPTIRGIRME